MSELTHESFEPGRSKTPEEFIRDLETSNAHCRQKRKEAQALAAKWERIACLLATKQLRLRPVWIDEKWQTEFKGKDGHVVIDKELPSEALLAWADQQKEPRPHRGISNGGDTCTDPYCWCGNPLHREYYLPTEGSVRRWRESTQHRKQNMPTSGVNCEPMVGT